jgi:hypothetical protein
MKPKRSKKMQPPTLLDGNWIDVDDLVKPGEIKEIAPGLWVNNTGVVLDPPEPIKKQGKTKPKKKSA